MHATRWWGMVVLWLAGPALAQPQLLLVGGHLPVCSSAAPKACAPDRVPEGGDGQPRYRVDADSIARVDGSGWLPHRQSQQAQIKRALTAIAAPEVNLDHDQLLAALARHSAGSARAWEQLASFEQDRVLDGLQAGLAGETVALAASREPAVPAILGEFVAMARSAGGRQRPRILVSTASSRDPYAAIDFYLQSFAQAGAEVRWLPLDHALRAAQADPARACRELDRLRAERLGAHDRERLYPERARELRRACRDPQQIDQALRWADGLFLNGGDQSYSRAAWFEPDGKPSAALAMLRTRLTEGSLVLGGTSAGTAVQASGSMIVSGGALPPGPAQATRALPPRVGCTQARACEGQAEDALLYHPDGGLASFALGVLDTHFSERGREWRLARLLQASGQPAAFGVDETTALRLDRSADGWQARVIGVGGVTVLRQAAPDRYWRWRWMAGERFDPAGAAPPLRDAAACADSARTQTLEADGPAQAQKMDQLRKDGGALRVRLRKGDRELDAGSWCAVDDRLLWLLPQG